MRYACEPADVACAYVYFDSDVFRGIEGRTLSVDQVATEIVPDIAKKIFDIYPVFTLVFQRNFVLFERYDLDIPFAAIAKKIAAIVSQSYCVGADAPQQISPEEFDDLHPNVIIHQPPTE